MKRWRAQKSIFSTRPGEVTLAPSKNGYEETTEVVISVLLFLLRTDKYESGQQKVQNLGDGIEKKVRLRTDGKMKLENRRVRSTAIFRCSQHITENHAVSGATSARCLSIGFDMLLGMYTECYQIR